MKEIKFPPISPCVSITDAFILTQNGFIEINLEETKQSKPPVLKNGVINITID